MTDEQQALEQQGPDLPGLTFQRKLGSGGFSDVYLYERERPRMSVAVKVLKADVMDPAQVAQFVAEADTMGELAEHPYIVPVLSAGTSADGRPYLEMRYYPGADLAERVKAQPMSVPDALKTGIQLASAIETAHRAGIIHRDIKPQNVLLSSYGVPGLADFGIAGRRGDVEEDESNVGVSMPWSPPEILTGTSNGSHASDVYSLGATIWNLLVGRSPFSMPSGDNSQRALFSRIVHSKPPGTGRADVPTSLERLLAQTMAKKPEHRPRSAMELARHLQRVEQELRLARTEIVVLEAAHTPTIDPDVAPHSNTPSTTSPYTDPTPTGGVRANPDTDRTTLRVPVRAKESAAPTADPTTRRPVRADTGAAPTQARPVRADTGAAPTQARPTRATTGPAPTGPTATGSAAGAAPTQARPMRGDLGAAPTTHRPTRAATEAAPVEAPSGGRGKWIAIGGVAALLAVIVGTGALLSQGDGSDGPPTSQSTTQAPGPTDAGELLPGTVLTPNVPVITAKTKGKDAVFTWEREQDGDTYRIRVVGFRSADTGPWKPFKGTSTKVNRLEGSNTCLQVYAVRAGGKTSTTYGVACVR